MARIYTRLSLLIAVLCLSGQELSASITVSLDPDSFAVGTDISTAIPEATLSAVGPGWNSPSGAIFAVNPSLQASPLNASTGILSFGTDDGNFPHLFREEGFLQLRVDFTSPTNFVELDFIADNGSDTGLMRAFNSSNVEIGSYTTAPISLNQVETMTISSGSFDIAYILAGGDSDLSAGGLDNLQFSVIPDFPSNASFATGSDQDVLNLDFGTVSLGDSVAPIGFQIANLLDAGSTARLDLVSVTGTGDTAALTTDLAPFTDLAAGDFLDFNAFIDTSVLGDFDATYELSFNDDLGTNQTLTLNVAGEVALANTPNIPDLTYNAVTGEVILDPDGASIIGYVLKNTTNSFLAGNHTPILSGVATSLPSEIAEAAFAGPSTPASIGNVFPAGMDITQLFNLLSVNEVSTGFGDPIVPFDLLLVDVVVPEPSTYAMAALALLGLGVLRWRRERGSSS